MEPLFYCQNARLGSSEFIFDLDRYNLHRMNWSQLTNGIKQIWENKPEVVVLLSLGFLVFLFIVLDARRHRRKNKGKHPPKY